MSSRDDRAAMPWRQTDGRLVACEEKLKVLNQNLEEIRQLCHDAFEDAILMGCDEEQVRAVLHGVIDSLQPSFRRP